MTSKLGKYDVITEKRISSILKAVFAAYIDAMEGSACPERYEWVSNKMGAAQILCGGAIVMVEDWDFNGDLLEIHLIFWLCFTGQLSHPVPNGFGVCHHRRRDTKIGIVFIFILCQHFFKLFYFITPAVNMLQIFLPGGVFFKPFANSARWL